MLSRYLWIGVGGCLGALARYWLGQYIGARVSGAFPLGTFVINVSGSLLLGFLATAAVFSPVIRQALGVGFLGAYTTFSTWSVETLRLLEDGRYQLAAANVFGSAAAGLAGAWAGTLLGRLVG